MCVCVVWLAEMVGEWEHTLYQDNSWLTSKGAVKKYEQIIMFAMLTESMVYFVCQ
jgi:hypothetical protein